MSEIIDTKSLGYEFKMKLHTGTDLLSDIIREKKQYSDNSGYIFRKFIKPNSYFLDIGANIGWYTLLANQISKDIKIFAYEPEPKNFDLLEQNIKLNNVKNVELIPKALGSETGEQELFLSENNLGDHILLKKEVHESLKNRKSITIPVSTLDEEFEVEEFKKVSFIKIDVQGFESFVLDGMKRNLKFHKPIMFLEYSPFHMYACEGSPFEIFAFIEKNGYLPYLVNDHLTPDTNKLLQPLDINSLLEITNQLQFKNYGCDLLLIPRNANLDVSF